MERANDALRRYTGSGYQPDVTHSPLNPNPPTGGSGVPAVAPHTVTVLHKAWPPMPKRCPPPPFPPPAPQPKGAVPPAATAEDVLQRISGAIGLLNESPDRAVIERWWGAILPTLRGV